MSLNITDDYSLEITAKDLDSIRAAAPHIAPGTQVAITFLPGEEPEARIATARVVRELGFEPMPHFSARRLASKLEFETYLHRVVEEAGVRRCFVIAGDSKLAAGPFADSSALIVSGAFERSGIETIGIGGHPEGHPNMTAEHRWRVLEGKCAAIADRGMAALIVTQFGFSADPFLRWLEELRGRGVSDPVRIGIPGPAGIKTLLRFAARCGVEASGSVLAKYGISISKLIGTAGPDKIVAELANGLGPQHGLVRLHFYPFGGLEKTVDWICDYEANN